MCSDCKDKFPYEDFLSFGIELGPQEWLCDTCYFFFKNPSM